MLELLSGPNAIFNANDLGSPIATLNNIAYGPYAFYDDGLGLCGYSATLGGYCIIQLDGAAFYRSYQSRANRFTLDMQRLGEQIIHSSLFEDELYLFDKGPGTRGDLVISGSLNDMSGLLVRASDRYLDVLSSSVRYRPLATPGDAPVAESTLTGAGSGYPTVSRTNSPDIVCFVWGNGPVAYYDVVARAQVAGTGNVGTNSGGWYSPKHDIFITLTDAFPADTIRVYANAVRPSTLSNPVAVTPLTQGRVSQVKVRLLGTNSDACVDELVNWSITAGVGAMAQAQSTTDATGWAYNDFIAPVSGGAGSPFGTVTIQAQVLY